MLIQYPSLSLQIAGLFSFLSFRYCTAVTNLQLVTSMLSSPVCEWVILILQAIQDTFSENETGKFSLSISFIVSKNFTLIEHNNLKLVSYHLPVYVSKDISIALSVHKFFPRCPEYS